jgi:hypothetical protein
MSHDHRFDPRRFTAASMALQGLLSGNGQLRTPTDEMCLMFARDALRFADALLGCIDRTETPQYSEPTALAQTIYPGEAREFPAEGEFLPESLPTLMEPLT